MSSQNTTLRLASFVLALSLAPAAHAGITSAAAPISRDTGVGLQIAAQGNQALNAIRADLRRAVRAWRPSLPAQPMTVSLPVSGTAGGGAASVAPAQRCAK